MGKFDIKFTSGKTYDLDQIIESKSRTNENAEISIQELPGNENEGLKTEGSIGISGDKQPIGVKRADIKQYLFKKKV